MTHERLRELPIHVEILFIFPIFGFYFTATERSPNHKNHLNFSLNFKFTSILFPWILKKGEDQGPGLLKLPQAGSGPDPAIVGT